MKQQDSQQQKSPSRYRVQGLSVAAALFVLLMLFSNKPVHLDDTLYLRGAVDFLEDPLHPYETSMNWNGVSETLWVICQNPPLHSYMLAAAIIFVGENEIPLHVIWALLAAGCTYLMFQIARRFCAHPLLATLLAVLNPGFFVSATSLMADISLIFFWLLAVYFAMISREMNRPSLLWLAAIFATIATMTKYFGVALVPLLTVWLAASVWMSRKEREMPARQSWIFAWFAVLCLPIAVVSAWGVYGIYQPGCGFFHPLGAVRYSANLRFDTIGMATNTLVDGARSALSFLGGSLVWPLFLLPVCKYLSRRLKIGLAVMILFVFVAGLFSQSIPYGREIGSNLLGISDVMAFTGAIAVILAAASCLVRRDEVSLLLGLWFLGTFVFCAFVNWTVNVRVILPALFPLCVLVVRWGESLKMSHRWLYWSKIAMVPTFVLTLIVAIADYDHANVEKQFAQTTVRKLIQKGEKVTFAGHWGFQYYMEKEGAYPLDMEADTKLIENKGYRFYRTGYIIYPLNNVQLDPKPQNITPVDSIDASQARFGVHNMFGKANAGFYSSGWGTAPYNFDFDLPIDSFSIYQVTE